MSVMIKLERHRKKRFKPDATCRRLLALAQESDAPITLLISSPGGHVESGDAIHDMIRFVRAPVTVIGTGWVASAGTHIYLAAPKERRLALPNTRFMIHQARRDGSAPTAKSQRHALSPSGRTSKKSPARSAARMAAMTMPMPMTLTTE